ncbi:MAG: sulfide/dihydroorotate dehydrogenase-like FAD/NAD-binding protein [Spirochaetaceae bacterium]|nr:sulfide/dihydroorotate dehydrogenase-like FAD/NAD-binding protein [Spirochaetaceae bacterium]
MNKILEKVQLSPDVFSLKIEAKHIAQARKAGQFIILMAKPDGERLPLTIADANADEGWILIIFQTVGEGTIKLAQLNAGDHIAHLLGPLGSPSHIEKYDGPVICIGGGVGVAPMHPIAKALKAAGNEVIIIIGARNKDLIIMQKELEAFADQLIICTDDGSAGRKALVTEPLKELCESLPHIGEVFTLGPPIMMKFCEAVTRPFNIPTTASLNTIMIDGTGMCGGCRVTIDGETKFVCVDGPEFDAHKVDWNNMMMRQQSYKDFEAETKHKCKIGLNT